MAGVIWRHKDLNDLRSEFAARGVGGQQVIKEILTDVAEEAAARMARTIETVPSGLVPGKIGRVDTGLMRDSVAASNVEQSGTHSSVKIGWVNRQEPYFLYQENGADNQFGASGIPAVQGGGRRIPPMHALLGAFIWAREEVKARIEDLTQ